MKPVTLQHVLLGTGAVALVGVCLYSYRHRLFYTFRAYNRVPAVSCKKVLKPRAAARGAPQGNIVLEPSRYPPVRREEMQVERLHGVDIADPYRWLEDPDASETQAFVKAQNDLSNEILASCATRQGFRELMTTLYNYPRFSCPQRHGMRYYYTQNTGLQAQSVLFSQATVDAEPALLLDPNTLSEDGTVALASWEISEDGRYMAYQLASGGSDWRHVKIMEINADTGAGADLPEKLEHVKFSSIAWTHDHKGFFYNRYPAPGTDRPGTETTANVDQQLWYHVVGTRQGQDAFVYAIPEQPSWMIGAEVSHDGRYLVLSISAGCDPANRLFLADLAAIPRSKSSGALDFALYDRKASAGVRPLPLVRLVDNFDGQFGYVANKGSAFTFHTNLNAPRYRLVRTDITAGSERMWLDVIPEHSQDLLQWAHLLQGDRLVICYLHNVCSQLQVRALRDGAAVGEVPLPGLGSVAEFRGRHDASECFFSFTSFTDPGSTFRYDVAQPKKAPTLHRKAKLRGDYDNKIAQLETRQVFVDSTGGVKVPMFIVSRKGATLDATNPCLLYGYGGFNISLEPGFSVARLSFLLAYNGVYAIANLRGGGEYGRAWRDAGSLHNKQNVFDDFAACAKHLHAAGYTSPAKTIIQGGSNGGLLVMACANQRPDLFAAVIGQVGVLDMLRFHLFTIGHAWVSDYGSPEDADDFQYLLTYSPLHNVRQPADGGQYPAIILTSGDHDDRVVPLHTLKMTATLQHTLGGPDSPQRNPLLARIEVRAGHGAGKPTDKVISECSDVYSFAAAIVGAQLSV